jgi:hypothetical protein
MKDNSKLVNLNEEIKGITEEILEKDESDIKDMSNLKEAAGAVLTQTMNRTNERNKNRRNENVGDIIVQS